MQRIKSKIVAVTPHDYRDATGRLVFQHVRLRLADGSKVPYYRRRPRPNEWTYGKLMPGGWIHEKPAGADDLLYRLPQLLIALEAQVPEVWWTEGESDADALAAIGLVVTSHHGGAGKATAAQAFLFHGYQGVVNLCVDRDRIGAYCAMRRRQLLRRETGLKPSQIRMVVAREGKDVRDHLEAGLGIGDLRCLPFQRINQVAMTVTPSEVSGYVGGWTAEEAAALANWKPRRVRA